MSAISTALVSTPSKSLYQPQSQSTSAIQRPQTNSANISSTPATQKLTQPPAPTPSPGTFRHPRLAEIISRQNKTTLSEQNVRSAIVNGSVLLFTLAFSNNIQSTLSTIFQLTPLSIESTATTTSTLIALVQILFLLNIVVSLRPILPYISNKDTIVDIPLTPSQRTLLGLPPSNTSSPASPSSFTTPPRYHHRVSSPSSTSTSSTNPTPDSSPHDRRSISATYSSSPLSTSRYTLGFSPISSPSTPQTQQQQFPRRTASGGGISSFSPNNSTMTTNNQSPLFHKAIDRDRRAREKDRRRTSSQDLLLDSNTTYGSSFGGGGGGKPVLLGRSQSVKEDVRRRRRRIADSLDDDSDNGKVSGYVAQPGVNYKWLYDKGFGVRRSGEW